MSETIYNAENPGEWGEKKEKHIPSIEVEGNTIKVQIGLEIHPMEPTHHIEWIGLFRDGEEIARKNLQMNEEPKATFENIDDLTNLSVREHCNLHGLWEAKVEA